MKFGLLGKTLSHSLSASIHKSFGLDYELFEVGEEDLEDFVKNGSWQGLNVTIPYKQTVLQYVDFQDSLTKRIGATNCLVKKDSKIYAYNTDYFGFKWLINKFFLDRYQQEAKVLLKDKEVLILGSGGASKAVRCVLEDLGCVPHIISRSSSQNYTTYTTLFPNAYLIVNTTPVGMYPNSLKSPVTDSDLMSFKDLKGVIDIVYNPYYTYLSLQAKKLGIPSVCGLSMLVAQAYRASSLFLPRDLGEEDLKIENEIRRLTYNNQNLVLIGMPSAGKTTQAKIIAQILNYKFLDIDQEFESEYGSNPSNYIRQFGIDKFRQQESLLISKIGSLKGYVIACGGGCVERAENYFYLKQNSQIVWLKRELGALVCEDRPVSTQFGIEELAKRRYPLYRKWADFEYILTSNIYEDAKHISEIYIGINR